MKGRVVNVFQIEYEKLPKMDFWTAFIGAYSHEEAVRQLERRVGTNINIVTSGLFCRLDDLSNEVRDVLLGKAIGSASPKEEKKEKKLFHSGRGRKPNKDSALPDMEPSV